MPTIEDARILAHIFECTARGIAIDYSKYDPFNKEDAKKHYKAVFCKLVRDIEYIKAKASSITWDSVIVEKLKCFSVRPETIDTAWKERIRGNCGGCMACNRTENGNYKALSLFGYCKPRDDGKAFFTLFDDIKDDYDTVFNSYNEVFEDGKQAIEKFKLVDGFHYQDGGMVVLGETCQNRALLYNLSHNFIFDWIYIADMWIHGMRYEGQKVEDSELYVSTNIDAERIKSSVETLMGLAACESSSISYGQLAIDAEWWKCIRKIRNNDVLRDKRLRKHNALMNGYYEKMGRRGLQKWCAPLIEESTPEKTLELPCTLGDALKAHLEETSGEKNSDDFAATSSTSASEERIPLRYAVTGALPEAQAAPLSVSRKRKLVNVPVEETESPPLISVSEERIPLRSAVTRATEAITASGAAPKAQAAQAPQAPQAAPLHVGYKRNHMDSLLHEDASPSATTSESKRAKLRLQLLAIKDKMVSTGNLADALVIMETVLELND